MTRYSISAKEIQRRAKERAREALSWRMSYREEPCSRCGKTKRNMDFMPLYPRAEVGRSGEYGRKYCKECYYAAMKDYVEKYPI